MDYQFKTQPISCQEKKGDKLLFCASLFKMRKILSCSVFFNKGEMNE